MNDDRNDRATNVQRNPDEWITGDEPMTAAQRSYLKTLSTEAHEEFSEDEKLTKAAAAKRINDLQKKTGRGPAGRSRKSPAKANDR